ncbi:MAG: DedA family protein [Actinomycetaceae bacterium]|nr:DedA family protein [Actinomycetaceae bacterium]
MSIAFGSIPAVVSVVPGQLATALGNKPTNLLDYLHDPEKLLWDLLNAWGPWLLVAVALIVLVESGLLFPVLPGDSLLFTLGLLHHQMHLDLWLICVVLIVAAIIGAQGGYLIGHFFGARFFTPDARFLKTEYLDTAEAFFNKWGGPALVLARFIPFVRTFTPIAVGMARFPYVRFLFWNTLGAVVWVVLFVVGGSLLGGFDIIRNNISAIALLIVFVSVLPMIFAGARAWLKSRQDKADS